MSKDEFDPANYNSMNIGPGDKVLVKISPNKYFAKVIKIKVDTKNRKVFAELSNVNSGLPIKVDVQDCEKINLLEPTNFS